MPCNTNMYKNMKTLKGLPNQSDENYQIMYDSVCDLRELQKAYFIRGIK